MTRLADADSLTSVLDRQLSVISRDQALAYGLSPGAIRHRLRAGGPWQKLVPGVYQATTGTVTEDQRQMAALLHAGASSVITGPAALRRHGLEAPASELVDVLIPASVRRESSAFVRVHHTRRMPEQFYLNGPLRFVSAPRAVADTARALTELREVRAVVASAVQRRRCTITLIAAELRAGPTRGSGLLAAALAEVADGIRSVAEGDFRVLLQRSGLPMPMFNARLMDGTTFLAVVDAWWQDAGVAVEVDSREWHFAVPQWEQTSERHALLSARGIIVLHFSPGQIKRQPETVLTRIRSALAHAPARATYTIQALPATS